MNLQELKGEYDAIFSLGDLCLTSIQLKRHNLRPFSGVFDWMASPRLSNVNRLLRNRFIGFMDYENLRIIGYAGPEMICVSDDAYQMVSNHDFSSDKNSLQHLGSYQEVREKYDRRIKRFLNTMEHAKKILFIRTEGSYEEAEKLQSVLSNLVKHDFRVLLINHKSVAGIVENNWPLEKVCALEFPNGEIWEGNNHLWQQILEGIQLKRN